MKKFALLLTIFSLGFLSSIALIYASNRSFSDADYNSWYGQALRSMTSKDIINGYPDGTFKPANYVTRAELVAILDKYDQYTLQRAEVAALLKQAGCFFDLGMYGVNVTHEGNNWVMSKNGCLGRCTIGDQLDAQAHIDSNPMCTSPIPLN